jgi:hypothetical protein
MTLNLICAKLGNSKICVNRKFKDLCQYDFSLSEMGIVRFHLAFWNRVERKGNGKIRERVLIHEMEGWGEVLKKGGKWICGWKKI